MAGAPTVIMTDQDHAIVKSIETMLPATTHKLCSWHMNQNLMKRLGSDKVNLKNAFVTFNKLIYDEELTETDFELEWGKIKSYFETDRSDSSSNRMRYLNSLYENRHKWSRSCCPVVFDAGLTTSQRAESFNALVKKHLCKKTTLDQLMKELLENVENREMETERDDNVRAKISGNRADTGFRVVTWLAKRLTRYAFKIAYEQFVASEKCRRQTMILCRA